VALLEKRRYLNNRSGDFPQVILIVPSHVPNTSQLSRLRVAGYFSCPTPDEKGGGVTQIRRQQTYSGPLPSLPKHSLNVLYCPFKFLNASSKTGLKNRQFLHVLGCPFLLPTIGTSVFGANLTVACWLAPRHCEGLTFVQSD
jgi:hypothetical protein